MKEINILECFGGIGACTKALKRLGYKVNVVDYVEIDKYAVASYNAINGTNFEPQDITNWDKDINVDLIMHGSPCQDFSLAGKQAGGDEGSGTRSSLMYETIQIVEKLKPKYVVWENVKNLLSKKHRHNFDAYLEIMEQLGYTNYYQVLNAKDYGIPQNRERVFTISILGNENYEFPNGIKCDNDIKVIGNYMPSGHEASRIVDENGIAPTVKENHGTVTAVLQRFEFPQKQELKLRLKDMLEDEVDEKYYLSEDKIDKISHWKAYQKPFEKVQGQNSIVPTLTARGAGEEHSGMITYSENLEETTNLQEECLHIKNNTKKGYLEATDGDGVYINRIEKKRGTVQKEMIQTLSTQPQNDLGVVTKEKSLFTELEKKLFTEDGNIRRYINSDIVDEFKEGEMATTTFPNGYGHGPRTHKESISLNTVDKPCVKHNLRIRKLTPKECWRLMGFDDEDFEKAAQHNSNTQLYKQAGNSIVVNVLEAIFNNLLN